MYDILRCACLKQLANRERRSTKAASGKNIVAFTSTAEASFFQFQCDNATHLLESHFSRVTQSIVVALNTQQSSVEGQ